jgi:hypothetical protein
MTKFWAGIKRWGAIALLIGVGGALDAQTDPYWGQTVLLLKGDGSTADSTGLTSLTGSPSISSTVYQYGTGSIYFNGSSVLSSTSNPNFAFGTGDFTVETW